MELKSTRARNWLIASLPLLILLPTLPLVSASPPVTGSGTFATTLVTLGSRTADGNTFDLNAGTTVFSGDFTATATWEGTLVIHADGSDNFEANGTITGSFLGSPSGTCSFKFEGQGAGAALHGTFGQEQCDGGLAGMNFEGTFTGSFTSATTATGPITFKVS